MMSTQDSLGTATIRQCLCTDPKKTQWVAALVSERYVVFLCNACLAKPLYEGILTRIPERAGEGAKK